MVSYKSFFVVAFVAVALTHSSFAAAAEQDTKLSTGSVGPVADKAVNINLDGMIHQDKDTTSEMDAAKADNSTDTASLEDTEAAEDEEENYDDDGDDDIDDENDGEEDEEKDVEDEEKDVEDDFDATVEAEGDDDDEAYEADEIDEEDDTDVVAEDEAGAGDEL